MNKLINKVARRGFTLIELMIVVAIIGILAAIAIPKFANLITKSKESSAKGSLGSMRSAVSIYYSDTEGIFPAVGNNLAIGLTTANKYLDSVPTVLTPPVSETSNPGHGPSAAIDTDATFGDGAGWGWLSATGQVYISCSHRDTRGSSWSTW